MTKPIGAEVARVARRVVAPVWRGLRVVLVVGVLSALLGGLAFATSSLYEQYGAPRTPVSQRGWAERPLTYLANDCAACHLERSTDVTRGAHQPVACESCHQPTVDHPGPVTGVVLALPAATSTQCVACHAVVPARPPANGAVDLDEHFDGVRCLACHDPHSSGATAPPLVSHPLARLPSCVTCHAPGGLKRFPIGHQRQVDQVCLLCHRPGIDER